eukprot:362740-Heterocapsa_arctica.AAC.1
MLKKHKDTPQKKNNKIVKNTDQTPRGAGTICRFFCQQIPTRACATAASPDERGPPYDRATDDRAYKSCFRAPHIVWGARS